MGQIEINHTGSGGGVVLSSDGTDLLLDGSAVGGGGASAYTREAKTANYTAVAGDLGKILDFTANSSTLSLTAAATLGAGWFVWVKNSTTQTSGDHEITIDPNGSETIETSATRILYRGQSMLLVCDGSNFFTISGGVHGIAINSEAHGGSSEWPQAGGDEAIAIGYGSTAAQPYGIAMGWQANAQGNSGVALGYQAYGSHSAVAIGKQTIANTANIAIGYDAETSTAEKEISIGYTSRSAGLNSIALGYSNASAAGSNAIGIQTNSSSYGASGTDTIAIGHDAKATQTDNVAIGKGAIATGSTRATAIGREAQASGNQSCAIGTIGAGGSNGALGDFSVAVGPSAFAQLEKGTSVGYYAYARERATALGNNARSLATKSVALGNDSEVNDSAAGGMALGGHSYVSNNRIGAIALNNGVYFAAEGDSQAGLFVLRSDTTDATAEAMTTNNATAASTNQITIPTDSCIMFSGTIVAMQNGAADQGGWEIKGLLKNDGGTTTLVNSNVQTFADGNSWAVALSADNTNNALKVQVTGEASHNIRWVANIQTSEVTYA